MILKHIAQRVVREVDGYGIGRVACGISRKNTQLVLISEDWPGEYCELLTESDQILIAHNMIDNEDINEIVAEAMIFIHHGYIG